MVLRNIKDLTPQEIASICDHTFLYTPNKYVDQAKKENKSSVHLWKEVRDNFIIQTKKYIEKYKLKPYAICVRPEEVEFMKSFFPDLKIASVVGFPQGGTLSYPTKFKAIETKYAIEAGADEIDMILNYDHFNLGEDEYCKEDIKSVVDIAHESNAWVKLILETSELSEYMIRHACELATECEVDFVKTSTGFSEYGATLRDLELMREAFEGSVKISGGVNQNNVYDLLISASGRKDGKIDLDSARIRIGESSLLNQFAEDICKYNKKS